MSALSRTGPQSPPDEAYRLPCFMAVTDVKGPDGRTLNLRTIIFVEGGSLVWFETPAALCVLHAFPVGREPKGWDGKVRRYEGTWEPKEADCG